MAQGRGRKSARGGSKNGTRPATRASKTVGRKRSLPNKDKNNVFEVDEDVDWKERAGRYDIDAVNEYELPENFDDEEIDEDAAFDSEDERQYGSLINYGRNGSAVRAKRGPASAQDSDDDGNSDPGGDYFSEEEAGSGNSARSGKSKGKDNPMMISLSDLLGTERQSAISTEDGEESCGARKIKNNSGEMKKKKRTVTEEAELELTDEEIDSAGEDHQHEKLLSSIRSTNRAKGDNGASESKRDQKRKKEWLISRDTNEAAESEFNLALGQRAVESLTGQRSTAGLTLDDLVDSLDTSAAAGFAASAGVKEKLKSLDSGEFRVSAPVERVISERAERKVVYKDKSKDVTRYQATVKRNRESETINFVELQQPARENLSHAAMAGKFQAKTEMEREIEQALREARGTEKEMVEREVQELQTKKALTLEEAKEKHKEIAKMRALMFYEEQKNKRIKKIKSKKYRKIRKKQKMRQEAQELERLKEEDPELYRQLEEQKAEQRAKERITLKHQNNSAWAKRVIKRGISSALDERKAIAEQLRTGEELRRKMNSMHSESDQDSDSDDEDGQWGADDSQRREKDIDKVRGMLGEMEEDGKTKQKGLFGMKFMQKAMDNQRERAKLEAMNLLKELEREKREEEEGSDTSDSGDEDDEDGEEGSGNRGKKEEMTMKERKEDIEKKEEAFGKVREDLGEGLQSKSVRMGKNVKVVVNQPISISIEEDEEEEVEEEPRSSRTDNVEASEGEESDEGARARGNHLGVSLGKEDEELDVSREEVRDPGNASRFTEFNSASGRKGSSEKRTKTVNTASKEGIGSSEVEVAEEDEDSSVSNPWLTAATGAKDEKRELRGVKGKARKERMTKEAEQRRRSVNGSDSILLHGAKKASRGGSGRGTADDGLLDVESALSVFDQGQQGKTSGDNEASSPSLDVLGGKPHALEKEGGSMEGIGKVVPKGATRDAGVVALQSRKEKEQEELVKRAFFTADDVEEELQREKEKMVDEEEANLRGKRKRKDMDEIQGWGSWAGQGVVESERQKRRREDRVRQKEKAKKERFDKRKDAKLATVVINEKRNKRGAKYLADHVPYPFKTREQYERAMRNPVGKDWNTEASARQMTRPEVITRSGVIIEPLKLTRSAKKEEEAYRRKQRKAKL